MSTVQGISTIYANKVTTASAKVLDSSGNLVSLPSTQLLFIQISNESIKGANFNLTSISGNQTVLDKEIFEQMTLANDGTYQCNFTITKTGNITISILLYTQGGVFAEYFNNMFLEGDNNSNRTETLTSLSYNWSTGAVTPTGNTDNVSARFHFLLKSPSSAAISFRIVVDDFAYLNIENNRVVSNQA